MRLSHSHPPESWSRSNLGAGVRQQEASSSKSEGSSPDDTQSDSFGCSCSGLIVPVTRPLISVACGLISSACRALKARRRVRVRQGRGWGLGGIPVPVCSGYRLLGWAAPKLAWPVERSSRAWSRAVCASRTPPPRLVLLHPLSNSADPSTTAVAPVSP